MKMNRSREKGDNIAGGNGDDRGFPDFRYCGRTGLWDGGLSVSEERGNGDTGWCTVGGSVGDDRRDLLRVLEAGCRTPRKDSGWFVESGG